MKKSKTKTKKEVKQAIKLAKKEIKEWERFLKQAEYKLQPKYKLTKLQKDMIKAGFPLCYEEKGKQYHCNSCLDGYRRKKEMEKQNHPFRSGV